MLIILTGIPASGKSSLAKELKRLLELENESIEIVDSDEIRRKTYITNFDPSLESFIREESLVNINNHLKAGKHVISDDINYYQSMRHELKEIARKNKDIFEIIHFDIPLEIALERNTERGEPIPHEVIEKINEKFDAPGKKYKWDKSFHVITGDNSVEKEAKLLVEKIKPFLRKKMEFSSIRIQAELNFAQEMDKITRNLVSDYVNVHEKDPKRLSELRKEFIKIANEQQMKIKTIKEKFQKFLDEKFGEVELK